MKRNDYHLFLREGFILYGAQDKVKLQIFVEKMTVPLISMLFMIGFYFSSRNLSSESVIYPKIIMTIMLVSIVINIGKAVKELLNKEDRDESIKVDPIFKKSYIPGIVVFLSTFIYILVMPHLGFGISTIAYLFGLGFYLGIRNVKLFIYVAIVFGFIYGVFIMWLQVRLPHGFFF